MKAFTSLTGIAAPYYLPNTDTDKLIPHRFLRKPLAAGYRNFLFYNERFTPEGEKKDFILHRAPFDRAQILVGGPNFGCGSSREGVIYALADFGIHCVIAPSFGDIFTANALQNGLLPVALPQPVVEKLVEHLTKNPGATVSVDLASQQVTLPDGSMHKFEIAPSRKERLLKGEDDISITLRYAQDIERFEAEYHRKLPWLAEVRSPRN